MSAVTSVTLALLAVALVEGQPGPGAFGPHFGGGLINSPRRAEHLKCGTALADNTVVEELENVIESDASFDDIMRLRCTLAEKYNVPLDNVAVTVQRRGGERRRRSAVAAEPRLQAASQMQMQQMEVSRMTQRFHQLSAVRAAEPELGRCSGKLADAGGRGALSYSAADWLQVDTDSTVEFTLDVAGGGTDTSVAGAHPRQRRIVGFLLGVIVGLIIAAVIDAAFEQRVYLNPMEDPRYLRGPDMRCRELGSKQALAAFFPAAN